MYSAADLIAGIKFRMQGLMGRIGKYIYKQPEVLDSFDTIEKIKTGCSLCRLGDGEFNLVLGISIGFQKADQTLSAALRSVLLSENEKCLVGIPDVFGDLSSYRIQPRRFWEAYLGRNRKAIMKLLKPGKQYVNTNVTRFQTGYHDPLYIEKVIEELKTIWYGREVVFIEGAQTRLGVGNDLFSNTKLINRVLVPPVNAFSRKNEIVEWVASNISRDKLLILACGPTATVIVPELTEYGFQALDLGHIDIQYEYYLRGITAKQAIQGKYVNESAQQNVDDIDDDGYMISVIKKFE